MTESPWKQSFRRFYKNKLAILGGIILLFILAFTYIGPYFSPYPNDVIDVVLRYKKPSLNHPFGTDRLGFDMMTKIMEGGRISLALATLSATVTIIFGTLVGAFAGYYGKWIDRLLMRLSEFIYVLPLLPMIIAFTAVFAFNVPPMKRMLLTMILYGFLSFPKLARMIRGEILSIKELEYIKATEILGLKTRSRVFRHLLPNTIGVIVASTTGIIANAILLELTLSFVGMGFPAGIATWGNLIPNIRGESLVTTGYYWMWFYPVTFISLTIISINLLGEGLRDALDPKGGGQ